MLSSVTPEQLEKTVTQAGYLYIPLETGSSTNQVRQDEYFYKKSWWPVLGEGLFTLPLVLPMLGMLVAQQWILPPLWQ